MVTAKPEDKYTKEAKKLLAWWQESLKEQWQHPDTLNAWINAMKHQPPGNPGATNAPKRSHAAHADGDDALRTLRAELRAVRTKLTKLERELAKLRGSVAKPASKRKPVSTPKSVSKRKPTRK